MTFFDKLQSIILGLFCVFLIIPFNVAQAHETKSNEAMFLWAQNAVVDVGAYGFHDLDKRLDQIKTHFTDTGYHKYIKAFNNARIRDMVLDRQMVHKLQVTCAPQIISFDAADQNTKLKLTILETWYAGDRKNEKYHELTLKIKTMMQTDQKDAFAIEQWVQYGLEDHAAKECDENNRAKAKLSDIQDQINFHKRQIEKLQKKLEKAQREIEAQ